jgi:hypothetical protein
MNGGATTENAERCDEPCDRRHQVRSRCAHANLPLLLDGMRRLSTGRTALSRRGCRLAGVPSATSCYGGDGERQFEGVEVHPARPRKLHARHHARDRRHGPCCRDRPRPPMKRLWHVSRLLPLTVTAARHGCGDDSVGSSTTRRPLRRGVRQELRGRRVLCAPIGRRLQ